MENMKDLPAGVQKRSGTKYIPFGDGDKGKVVVGMCEFKDNLYCATQEGIYILREEQFDRLELKEKENAR